MRFLETLKALRMKSQKVFKFSLLSYLIFLYFSDILLKFLNRFLYFLNEDIKLDLSDDANSNEFADGGMKNGNKSKKPKKSGFKSMDKFLEKFGKDEFYTDKIHKVDKNKMFFNHFKNKLPKFRKN